MERLRIEECGTQAEAWTPVAMHLLREEDGVTLAEADAPWFGSHCLILRRAAAELIEPLTAGQAELLPLICDDADLWLLHAIECRDALDPDESDLVRFSAGRIMTVRKHVFDPKALRGARCFRDSKTPRGPLYLAGDVVDVLLDAGISGFHPKLVWEDPRPR